MTPSEEVYKGAGRLQPAGSFTLSQLLSLFVSSPGFRLAGSQPQRASGHIHRAQ
jgi:hypothetical protein